MAADGVLCALSVALLGALPHEVAALQDCLQGCLHPLEQTECLDWINTCNLLLSGLKSSPTNLISTDELINMFGAEVLQSKRELPPHPEDSFLQMAAGAPEERKQEKEDGAKEAVETKQVLETEPTASSTSQQATKAIICPIRYIGEDSNVHIRPLEIEQVTVSGRELYASQWTTKFSRREFEMLASLEILEERLLEAEKRAQEAEEKSESLHEQLEEALAKIQDLEGEGPDSKSPTEEAPKFEPEDRSKEKPGASSKHGHPKSPSSRKKSKPKR